MKKMTYVNALDLAIANLSENEAIYDGANTISPAETVERLAALRDTLVKRANTPHKPSPQAREAMAFREVVREYVCNMNASSFTIKEVAKGLDVKSQRVTAAFVALVKEGFLIKGDGWYEVAKDEDEGE